MATGTGPGLPPRGDSAPYLPMLVAATLCYLVVELAFGAHLLDATGGGGSAAEIVAVARWGRIISGVALTLAVWGTALLPLGARRGWGRRRSASALALSAVLCIGGAWTAERALVDGVVAASDGAARQRAAQMHVLAAAVSQGTVVVEGMNLPPGTLSRPEGKALLAMFPFIAGTSGGVAADPGGIMRQVYASFAERHYGTAQQVYDGVFIPSVRALRDIYGRYVAAQRRLADAVRAIPARAAASWAAQEAAVRRARWGAAPAANAARGAGAPVPDGWQLWDRAGDRPGDRRSFEAAFAAEARRRADAEYAADVAAIGVPLPPGLDWDAFAASAPIQARWRAALGVPEGTVLAVPLSASLGFAAFRDQVYQPALDQAARQAAARLLGPVGEYADGGHLAAEGREAVEWLVVPPLALGLSLLGAFVHLFKVSSYTIGLLAPGLRLRRAGTLAAVLALALVPFGVPNAASSSAAFSYFEARTLAAFGPVAATASRWIVQAEPFVYPAGDAARRYGLFGWAFEWGGGAPAAGGGPAAPAATAGHPA